ncbi:C40 family peptidase [Nonomuraea soli]|uniref:Cell wall-associated NlpC family hydrolase n=1 Tax=Nonomuraea soli TaxID=1032476 RepID=A0A7W0HN74_9ACTN|nr:C40 family peptidase [Nonomuraea soli]MBA2889494.1 cell wall-associated NlpC family hydrolase [Nonomuraea soli]
MRLGRVPLAAAMAAGVLLMHPGGAMADPRPTIKQAKARLEKLNDKADKVVDRYNKAAEEYRAARGRYTKLNGTYKEKLATVAGLRGQVTQMAADTYRMGTTVVSWPAMMGGDDPTLLLNGMALSSQITGERAQRLQQFDAENRGLKARRDAAQAALAEADKHRDGAAAERAEVLKLIKQQKALLVRLGAYRVGNPNSTGIKYSGPATGNAAAALSFAYAQVGKPYQFGGTGPGGYDCSGLTQASWRQGGVDLPRTTWDQWNWGKTNNRMVDLNSLQAGDLIFSEGLGHVSLYAGDGKIVHAPQTGDVVKVVSLSDYGRPLVGAVRP